MVIPCAVKRELKQLAQLETQQQSNQGQYKISCASFYQLKQIDKKGGVIKQILPLTSFSSQEKNYFSYAKKIILPDFFNYQKEKISSYLLFERFLI